MSVTVNGKPLEQYIKKSVTVTVNDQPVEQYIKQEESKEKSCEISCFLRDEMRSFGRVSRHHIMSSARQTVSKVEKLGNGVIRCA